MLYAEDGESPLGLMQYFTTNSNILAAVSALMILPFAIEGIRKKRFSCPRWAAMLHYAGTICTTLTMIFAVCFISWNDPTFAFGVAMAIRAVYHRFGQRRRTQLMKRLSEEMDPVEIRIELYGLGRYMGMHEDEHFTVLPLDIIRMPGERFRLTEEELIRPYNRGLLDARKERRSAGE